MKTKQIKLDKRIYPEKAVQETITAFKEICDVSLESEGNKHLLNISPKEKRDEREITGEFCNHCLCNIR